MSNIIELTDHCVRVRCPACGYEWTLESATVEAARGRGGRYWLGSYCPRCTEEVRWAKEV